jgi:hypothetical protein
MAFQSPTQRSAYSDFLRGRVGQACYWHVGQQEYYRLTFGPPGKEPLGNYPKGANFWKLSSVGEDFVVITLGKTEVSLPLATLVVTLARG